MIPPHLANAYAPPTVDTTDGTTTAAYIVDIPLNSIVEISMSVRARRRTTFGVSLFRRVYRVQNSASTLTLLQELAPLPDQNANGYVVSCAVNSTTGQATVSFTGTAGHNVEWQIHDLSVIQ